MGTTDCYNSVYKHISNVNIHAYIIFQYIYIRASSYDDYLILKCYFYSNLGQLLIVVQALNYLVIILFV